MKFYQIIKLLKYNLIYETPINIDPEKGFIVRMQKI